MTGALFSTGVRPFGCRVVVVAGLAARTLKVVSRSVGLAIVYVVVVTLAGSTVSVTRVDGGVMCPLQRREFASVL